MRKEEDIKVRVPHAMKAALEKIAASRMTTTSEIAREALLGYLASHNITAETLRESVKPADQPEAKPTTYRRKSTRRL